MILYENQCFELLKALCYSVPQNPNVGRFEIADVIFDTLQKNKRCGYLTAFGHKFKDNDKGRNIGKGIRF